MICDLVGVPRMRLQPVRGPKVDGGAEGGEDGGQEVALGG